MEKYFAMIAVAGYSFWNYPKENARLKILIDVKDMSVRDRLGLRDGFLQPCAIAQLTIRNASTSDSDGAADDVLTEYFIPDGPPVHQGSLIEVSRGNLVKPSGNGFACSYEMGRVMHNPLPEADGATFLRHLQQEQQWQPRRFWFPKKMESHTFAFYR